MKVTVVTTMILEEEMPDESDDDGYDGYDGYDRGCYYRDQILTVKGFFAYFGITFFFWRSINVISTP